MSLGNTSETLKIIDVNEAIIDTASYNSSMGANGDGKTFAKSFRFVDCKCSNSRSGKRRKWLVFLRFGFVFFIIAKFFKSASSVANSGGGSIPWPDEPQIYANAGKDKMGIAGADVLFEGKALGIKKNHWKMLGIFGILATVLPARKNIKHTYKYPNNYIVVLDVSSGQYSVSDKTNVKITPNELIISEASDEFIKLKNKSGVILDISGWFLTGGEFCLNFRNLRLSPPIPI